MWYYLSLLICGLGKILKKNSFPSPKNSSQPVPFWGVHNIEKIHKNAPSVHGGAISLCVKFGFLPSWTNSAQSNLLIFIDNIYLSCCTLARLCFPPRFFFFLVRCLGGDPSLSPPSPSRWSFPPTEKKNNHPSHHLCFWRRLPTFIGATCLYLFFLFGFWWSMFGN